MLGYLIDQFSGFFLRVWGGNNNINFHSDLKTSIPNCIKLMFPFVLIPSSSYCYLSLIVSQFCLFDFSVSTSHSNRSKTKSTTGFNSHFSDGKGC